MQNRTYCILGLLFVMIFTALGVMAQDNYNYQTPIGESLYYEEVNDANGKVLSMDNIKAISSDNDGLAIIFSIKLDLTKVVEPIKLISFTASNVENSYLDVFYHDETLIFRKKFSPGSQYYYDYKLYDPLFVADAGVTKWEIKLLFTGFFMWIESRYTNKLLNNKWHAPLFFGINLPENDFMSSFLNRSSTAKLIFGDRDSMAIFTMPDEIEVREFNYGKLKDELQNNFCNQMEM